MDDSLFSNLWERLGQGSFLVLGHLKEAHILKISAGPYAAGKEEYGNGGSE
jgi:hypothetical protein